MEKINEVVLGCIKELMDEKGIESELNEDTELDRNIGIDSLGIVTLVLNIEDKLDLELDKCLGAIRKCKTVKEMIEVIQNAQ